MRRTAAGQASAGSRASPDAGETSICVAICTHDRPDMLGRALDSLMRQSVQPTEIIVVDNAPSTEDAKNLVLDHYPGARYVREPLEGLNFARNRALEESSCEIVAFVDDDVVASSAWLESVRGVFVEFEDVAICTGRVEPLSLETEGQSLFEKNRGFSHGDKRIHLSSDRAHQNRFLRKPLIAWSISVGVGCNFSIRRRFAVEIGGFDEALDLGSALPGGGDHDLIWRALQVKAEILYEPDALVWHEHRRNRDAAIEQILEHNRATVAMLTKAVCKTHGRQRIVAAAFLVWRLFKPAVRLVRRAFGRDPLPASTLVRLWHRTCLGITAYGSAQRLVAERRRT